MELTDGHCVAGMRVIMVVCVLGVTVGCREGHDSQRRPDAASNAVGRKMQEALSAISDWRLIDDYVRYRETMSKLRDELIRVSDPVQHRETVNRIAEIAFSYPIDAIDPNVRKRQFFAFCEMSGSAALYAYGRRDLDSYWEILIRRLWRIRDEALKVEAYLDGKEERRMFSGDLDRWRNYHKRVKGEFEMCDQRYTRQFGDYMTAELLSCARWHSLRSQLEEILEHKIEIWDDAVQLMRKKQR